MYAHRNEDIVNARPGSQVATDVDPSENMNFSRKNSSFKSCDMPKKQNKATGVPLKKQRKSTEFGHLAQFMGMDELEFSKWLLNASQDQRKKVLQDYKHHKKRDKMGQG